MTRTNKEEYEHKDGEKNASENLVASGFH